MCGVSAFFFPCTEKGKKTSDLGICHASIKNIERRGDFLRGENFRIFTGPLCKGKKSVMRKNDEAYQEGTEDGVPARPRFFGGKQC